MNDFPERLRIALDKRNMSQTQLAMHLGISKSLVNRYLKGQFLPKTDNLINICKVLNVSPAYLLGKSDVMEDVGGLDLIKFMRESTPEFAEIEQLSIEERHCAFIYGECKTLTLKQLEEVENYISYIKSKK